MDLCPCCYEKGTFHLRVRKSTCSPSAVCRSTHLRACSPLFHRGFPLYEGDILWRKYDGDLAGLPPPPFVSCLHRFTSYVSALCANDDCAAISPTLHKGALLAPLLRLILPVVFHEYGNVALSPCETRYGLCLYFTFGLFHLLKMCNVFTFLFCTDMRA